MNKDWTPRKKMIEDLAVKALAALLEDKSSILSTHMVTYNYHVTPLLEIRHPLLNSLCTWYIDNHAGKTSGLFCWYPEKAWSFLKGKWEVVDLGDRQVQNRSWEEWREEKPLYTVLYEKRINNKHKNLQKIPTDMF